MAKIRVHFQLSHGQEQITHGNMVVDMESCKTNLHEKIQKMIAEQFNCPASIISITELFIQS